MYRSQVAARINCNKTTKMNRKIIKIKLCAKFVRAELLRGTVKVFHLQILSPENCHKAQKVFVAI